MCLGCGDITEILLKIALTHTSTPFDVGWLSGERVRLMTWWLLVRSPVEVTFLPAYFPLSPLKKHVRKVVRGFGKKSCVSTGARKPGNMYVSPTAMI